MLKKLLLFVFLITCFSGFSQFDSPTYKKGIMDTLWLKQANNKIWRLKVLHDTVLINNDTLIMGGIIMHDSTSFWQRIYGVISPTTATDTVQSNTFELGSDPYWNRRYVMDGGGLPGKIRLISGELKNSLTINDSTAGYFKLSSENNNGDYVKITGAVGYTGQDPKIDFHIEHGTMTNDLVLDKYGLHPASGQSFNLGYGTAPFDTTRTHFVKIDSLKALVSAPAYVLAPDANGVVSKIAYDSISSWQVINAHYQKSKTDSVLMYKLQTSFISSVTDINIIRPVTFTDVVKLKMKLSGTSDSVLVMEKDTLKYRILTLPDTTKTPFMFSPTGIIEQRVKLQRGFLIDDSVTTWHGMSEYKSLVYLADDDSLVFFPTAHGSGTITALTFSAGDSVYFADIDFTGSFLHIHTNSSTSVVKTNTDNKLCVGYWNGGNAVIIKNRTGEFVNLLMDIRYYIPL